MHIPEALIMKYSVSGPRYTSYPTAAELKSSFSSTSWFDMLGEMHDGEPASFYIHLPFCHSLCYFCACHKIISASRAPVGRYLEAVSAEMRLYSALIGKHVRVDHLHLGGGTPNFLYPEELHELIDRFDYAFPGRTDDTELSIELDPRTVTAEHVRMLALLGFSRISCGVQDFHPAVQEAINRRQSYGQTKALIDSARQAGILEINIDLIYGLPSQTAAGFARTIEQVIELRPERIALYGYAHLPAREKVQTTFRRFPLPVPAERVAIFSMAVEQLSAAGYEHIGMDHFSLPTDGLSQAKERGTLRRNFMGYTDRVSRPLIGLGASSLSSSTIMLVQNEKEVGVYEKRALEAKEIPISRGLIRSSDECIRSDVIERLLCKREVDCRAFSRCWGINFREYFDRCLVDLEELEADGLVEWSDEKLKVTVLGAFFLRNIAMAFDHYLLQHKASGKQVFSQTV